MTSIFVKRTEAAEYGRRLGVSFMRAQIPELDISLGPDAVSSLRILQSGVGILGISTVVWDCALFLIDYLIHISRMNSNLGQCLGKVKKYKIFMFM